jgi:predicted DNA-binding transcriptional regulator YafY
MNRIDRLFGILVVLQSKKHITAETIAEKFDISLRTVYRDMKALGEQGIPISFEPHKGYCIVPGYFLPPVSFTNDEANAFLLMEYLVNGFADKSIQTNYTNALSKIKAVLKNSQKEKLEILHSHTKFQLPTRIRNDYEYLSVIQNSIANQTIIEVEYKNNKEETSQRQIETIGLIFYAFSWHIIGWCHLRKDYRDFKVSRIAGLRDTLIPFTRSDHMEIGDYMKELPVDW